MYLDELCSDLQDLQTLTEEEACIRFNCDSKDEIMEILLDEIKVIEDKENEKLAKIMREKEIEINLEKRGYDY